ncbi:hypothetical protein BC834DRAFT_970209 [Gloeopeniophorella convolvens]|nr:hypothetical protein BC834DRAFT_970209 [Gloeopeniophorella convolvens]
MATSVHRRKSSREEEENLVIAPNGTLQLGIPPVPVKESKAGNDDTSPSRNRTLSTPSKPPSLPLQSSYLAQPPSAGPFRTGFNLPHTIGHPHSASPLRPSFSTPTHLHVHGSSHSRTRTISAGPFAPPSPSPLSMSFPSEDIPSSSSGTPPLPSSATLPEFPRSSRVLPHVRNGSYSQLSVNGSEPPSSPSASGHPRRHSRIHSRNLSVFFPRPGSLPHSTIAEDGAQELEVGRPPNDSAPTLAGVSMPGASPTVSRTPRKLGEGFTFGSRPPPSEDDGDALMISDPPPPRTSRRGHHHKHSLSHNFFSFLEPGSTGELTSQPAPMPLSPWAPTSPLPRAPSEGASPVSPLSDPGASPFFDVQQGVLPRGAVAASLGQFGLGAWLWITGQGVGSLACTGLGYWIVFDAIGVAVSRILPAYLQRPTLQAPIRRPFGTRRLETVALFAQVVYLMFSAVYVFKETVEHILLSAGEGHHHHPGDEDVEVLGIDFPVVLTVMTLVSLFTSSLLYDNHSKLVNVTGNHLPPLSALLDPARFRYSQHTAEPSSQLDRILRNPYSLAPITVSAFIIITSTIIPTSSHRTFDLLLAAAEATAMFNLAYPSCKIIGAVLLQTAPPRGLSAGRMESFLRAMREIERHPQVLHLPPPHIWQLAPSAGAPQPLVVTLELRVAPELRDADVLRLTRWAWERCVLALGLAGREQDGGGVTVGIVRG